MFYLYIFLKLLKVVLSHATHLFFDQPQEPDPEEPGLYWATRFTDAMKAFHFLPDRLYDNIAEKRSGERLTKSEVCGENMEKCPPLANKKNIIGMWELLCFKTSYTSTKSKKKKKNIHTKQVSHNQLVWMGQTKLGQTQFKKMKNQQPYLKKINLKIKTKSVF